MAKGDIISRLKLESGEFDSKIKRAGQELLAYAEHCRKMSQSMGYANKDAKDFAKALGSMQTVSQTARGKINELSEAFVNAKVMYKNMTDEEKKGEFGKNLAASLDQLKSRLDSAKKDLADVQKELNGGGSKFGEFGNVIDTLGSKLGMTGNLTELLTSKTALLTGAVGAGIAVVTKSAEAWASYNAELAKQDQITTVTTGLKGEDADRMTDKMRALSDTYKVDFREAVNAANTLMTQFGKTGDEATQLIKDGMQGMIQGDGPKLLSMIQQYAPAFRDAGVSASQLVAVIQNSEGGIFTDQNMNAIVMGIKNIRLMTKATSDALAQLGIDGEKMSKQLSDGSLTVFDALKQVAAQLQTVDSNSKTAGEVMQQVFGRQGMTAGTNLAKAIETLNTNIDETKQQTGDLGKSYAQLQEANEKLNKAIRDCFEYDGWEQMTIGIKTQLIDALSDVLEVVGKINSEFKDNSGISFFNAIAIEASGLMNPLVQVLSTLKEIRKLANSGKDSNDGIGYADIDKAQQWINNGSDDDERRRRYEKAIADLQRKLNNIGKEYAVRNSDGSVSYKIDDDETQAKKRNAIERRMRMLYATRYIEPIDTDDNNPIKPIKPTQKTKTTTTKHLNTEEQKNNEQIQKLTQEYIKASDERRAAIRAEIKDLQDKNKAIKQLTEEAHGLKFDDGSLPALTKQLQELQQAQSKAADGKELNEYQKKIDATNDKINVLKGNLPKDKQATFTMNVNAEQLEKLRALLPADDTIKINVEQGNIDLPKVPTDDETITVNITANTSEALQKVQDYVAEVDGKIVNINVVPVLTDSEIDKQIQKQYGKPIEVPVVPKTRGQQLEQSIRIKLSEENMEADKQTLRTLLETQIKYGIESVEIPTDTLLNKIMGDGLDANIPDEYWSNLQDQINEKLKDMEIDPLNIDFTTGENKGKSRENGNLLEESKRLVAGLNQVAGGLQQMGIKLPEGVSKVLGVVNGAISVIEGIGTIISVFQTSALTANTIALGALTTAVWANVVSNAIPFFANGGVVPAFADGGLIGKAAGGMLIPGNSFSGDNLRMPVDGGRGFIGVNSGELILNKVQQNSLAGMISDVGLQNIKLEAVVNGEQLLLVQNNRGLRTGRGEIVQSRRK